jgi:acyl-CoA synthetase (AMP-forming)/AMP-acid ligase II
MPPNERTSLWMSVNAFGPAPRGSLVGAERSISLADLVWGSSLEGRIEDLRGASVLVATSSQLNAALALVELDGIARRLIVCPPELPREHLCHVVRTGAIDAVVSDIEKHEYAGGLVAREVMCGPPLKSANTDRHSTHETEWILFSSGTTGVPKMVLHRLASLTGAIKPSSRKDRPFVWSTFYDIRRYGGLQILLRSLLGGESLVVSDAKESTEKFLIRAGANGVTHISGTPSHWRKALMTPSIRQLKPNYVRLSGETVDQEILDSLRNIFPKANIVHAFASTEAGLAFEVRDCLSGFPASLMGSHDSDVEITIREGSLRIRSSRTAARYLGNEELTDKDGFVDTHDLIELRGDRYYFIGRADGVINVGGFKVHPEEVEQVINTHPGVQMSLVKARRNPITGALVVAEVVAKPAPAGAHAMKDETVLRTEILDECRRALPPHKVPATIRFVPSLEIAASGKLARR